ncbi:uncharacterized protein LOC6557095 [Drosophila grimshawi]|uniref:GH14712 n=1 Tax=Drosophila grimshawi TaxID=7222 RepID=B4IX71_DROGR|nr:uncharacterized protein LOC6557095 [Drosophila grimshawi]EDV97403.1 GH14712 [Drosophila grimshawi]
MTSLTSEDLEDQLDSFIIRKPRDQTKVYTAVRKETNNGQKIFEHIPLLVGDILQSTPVAGYKDVFTAFNPATLNYRSCLVYGYVAGRGVHNKFFYKYLVDDGTGTIEISIFSKPNESDIIRGLYNEAKNLVYSAGSGQYEKVSGCMIRLLGKAMEHIDGSAILLGSNVLLFGRPSCFRNKITLEVISFAMDNGRSRQLEIAFNDNLIDYYQSHKAA